MADLRAEQDDDHRGAWSRWSDLETIRAQVAYDGAGAVAIVEEFAAAEEARRRRHEALLTEVEEDAAATARALRGGLCRRRRHRAAGRRRLGRWPTWLRCSPAGATPSWPPAARPSPTRS